MHDIDTLKEKYKGENAKRFLYEHGCKTWKEYELKFDTDYSPFPDTLKGRYIGYPFVFGIEDWNDNNESIEKASNILEWLGRACIGKTRYDFEFALKNHITGEWVLETRDTYSYTRRVLFVAFKDERDAMLFELVWM